MSFSEKPKKLLIITSSGGGGLLQAAVAKEQQALSDDPDLVIVKRDVLRQWLWKGFGHFCIQCWNRAQRKGDVRAQRFFMAAQWLFDYISWPHVFFHTIKILFQEEIDRVIDTQNMCTSAIIKAIRLYNRKKSKQITLEKFIVDMPTKKATHYFRPIKNLSAQDKKILKIQTIVPLLEEGQTSEEFWQQNCGISESEIDYDGLNVRQSFKKLIGKPRKEGSISLSVRFQSSEELDLMQRSFSRGLIEYTVHGNEVHFKIDPRDKVITVMLGSQPANAATLGYIKKFFQIAQEGKILRGVPVRLFVFCSDHKVGEKSLFRTISQYCEQFENYPQSLTLIPFSFQGDDVIAPLFHRSDLTCTRSGGQTVMELMAVSSGEMWIHSEASQQNGNIPLDILLRGIPGWESASALYLHKMHGAKIVTPHCAEHHAHHVFETDARRGNLSRHLESSA